MSENIGPGDEWPIKDGMVIDNIVSKHGEEGDLATIDAQGPIEPRLLVNTLFFGPHNRKVPDDIIQQCNDLSTRILIQIGGVVVEPRFIVYGIKDGAPFIRISDTK